MIGLHTPDGLLSSPLALALAMVCVPILFFALRRAEQRRNDRLIPLAGLMAAFLFVAQMVNFPIGAGTSGHLVGGALAAILLGPDLAAVALSVVVLVQALLFSDGGLTALGINLFNLAIVPTYGGWGTYRMCRRALPDSAGGMIGAAGLAGAVSVELSAFAFSVEWALGATAPVSFTEVFAAMVGVHLLIAAVEGSFTGAAVGTVLARRPDLAGSPDDIPTDLSDRTIGWRPIALGVVVATFVFALVAALFSSAAPDGLESVVEEVGIETDGGAGLFSDYAFGGDNQAMGVAVAALTGAIVCGLVGFGLLKARRST